MPLSYVKYHAVGFMQISLLSLKQAEKQVVELCSYYSQGRNFRPNSFLTQFAAHTITPRWVELLISKKKRVIHDQ
jgi:hypothetical protein